MGDLQRLSVTMEANKDQLPDLEALRLKFAGIVTQSLETRKQQVAFQASKQASSKQLQKLLTEGKSMADVLRTAVKNHFGSCSPGIPVRVSMFVNTSPQISARSDSRHNAM